jgi:adenine/guanine phosphoribosyltransferase-like PRPP-binding protein
LIAAVMTIEEHCVPCAVPTLRRLGVGAIRVKFENGAVSTEKNFAPAAWLARQMSASVIASLWQ